MERIADVEKVLMNEIDNLHGVYLYLEGDSWSAIIHVILIIWHHTPVK